MDRDEILAILDERKGFDEIKAGLNANRKELKRELRRMLDGGVIESEGDYFLVIGCIFLGFYLFRFY